MTVAFENLLTEFWIEYTVFRAAMGASHNNRALVARLTDSRSRSERKGSRTK